MRLPESGRNPKKRKAYEQQPDLLLVGVDVSKAKHSACIGTPTAIHGRQLEFTHPREGVSRFEQALREQLGHHPGRRLLMAMAPAGSSWHALYERLKSGGDGGCLVHGPAVRHHRKTRPEGASKTDEKAAYSVFAWLLQGPFFLPVARAPELRAA